MRRMAWWSLLGGNMLAEDIIRKNRESLQRLKNMHDEAVSTSGESGLKCLDEDEFMKMYNWTDREILEQIAARGVEITNMEEYLKKVEKKEKTD